MITYNKNSLGNIFIEGIGTIPSDPLNRHYAKILREVAAETAEIVSE